MSDGFHKVWRVKPFVKGVVLLQLLLATALKIVGEPLQQRAVSLFLDKQYESSYTLFDTIHLQNPGNKEELYNLGLCSYQLKNYQRAINLFEQCLQIDSTFTDALWWKGLALQQMGRAEQALAVFEALNTNNTRYNGLQKRIKTEQLTVILSKYWYYMVAILFMGFLFAAVLTKFYVLRKG